MPFRPFGHTGPCLLEPAVSFGPFPFDIQPLAVPSLSLAVLSVRTPGEGHSSKHYSLPFDDELYRAVVATHDIAQDRGIVDALGKAL